MMMESLRLLTVKYDNGALSAVRARRRTLVLVDKLVHPPLCALQSI